MIHAAALKQVPAAEYNPVQCIKTNVLGAQNLIEACLDSNVQRLSHCLPTKPPRRSTYTARRSCAPTNSLWRRITSGRRNIRFSVVRYGNVLGSRGSVIPLFMKKKVSGVLPITDPRMTRFSISLREGVEMVLWSN